MLAGAAFGHHSFAIVRLQQGSHAGWRSKGIQVDYPHIHIYVKVPDGKGGAANGRLKAERPITCAGPAGAAIRSSPVT